MFQGQNGILVIISSGNVQSGTTTKPAICFAIEDMIAIADLDGLLTPADVAACQPVTASYGQAYVGQDDLPHYTTISIMGYKYSIDSRDEPKLLAEFLGVKPQPYGTAITRI